MCSLSLLPLESCYLPGLLVPLQSCSSSAEEWICVWGHKSCPQQAPTHPAACSSIPTAPGSKATELEGLKTSGCSQVWQDPEQTHGVYSAPEQGLWRENGECCSGQMGNAGQDKWGMLPRVSGECCPGQVGNAAQLWGGLP